MKRDTVNIKGDPMNIKGDTVTSLLQTDQINTNQTSTLLSLTIDVFSSQ